MRTALLSRSSLRSKKLSFTIISFFVIVVAIYQWISARNYFIIEENDIQKFLVPVRITSNDVLPKCPHVVTINSGSSNLSEVPVRFNSSAIVHGGAWKPFNCRPQHKVAVIVPYKNRETQLNIFLSHMHGFLQAQQLDYQIFIVEQTSNLPFNRGLLCNIGFVEVLERYQIPCFIFHDVDLLPENLQNMYGCTLEPRHMSSCMSTFEYDMPYVDFFGGVVSFLEFQFQAINGFSNLYFGWGGEDDDLFLRTKNRGLNVFRYANNISRYFMLPHKKETLNPKNSILLDQAVSNQDLDGISNVKTAYTLLDFNFKPLFTRLQVNLLQPDAVEFVKQELPWALKLLN